MTFPRGPSSTFSDSEFHSSRRQRQQQQQQQRPQQSPRWSYELQDIPSRARRVLFDVNIGYAARLSLVFCAIGGLSFGLYQTLFLRRQEHLPLAQRSRFAPRVPATLLEKTRIGDSGMILLRFALPNSYDYCGYEPVSSVQVTSGAVRELSSITRWYTPISHPATRGVVEFAIRDRDPGRMAARLRYLERGDRVLLGRWMKEFPYRPNTYGELGVVCTTSGASIALQLMRVMDANKEDTTRLRFLYCHHTARGVPFKDMFEDFARRNPERISVRYNVMSLAQQSSVDGVRLGENFFLGHIDPNIIAKALPPPVTCDAATGEARRPKILICGPQSMLLPLCGRVSPIGNYTYWQGPFYKFGGFLRDMGYSREQVYKFGVSTHLLAYH